MAITYPPDKAFQFSLPRRMEVAAAMLKATRNPDGRHRLSVAMAEEALGEFLEWPVSHVSSDGLTLPAFRPARRFGRSFYDGLCLALAEATRTPLVHADEKLRKTLAGRFSFALWIEEYQAIR